MKVTKLDRRFTLYHRGYIHAIVGVDFYGSFMKHVKSYFGDKDHLYDYTIQRKKMPGMWLRQSIVVIGFKREEDLTMVLLSYDY